MIIVSFYYPPYEGVGANRWKNISLELAKLGIVVQLITLDWPGEFIEFNQNNLHIHRISSKFNFFVWFKFLKFESRFSQLIKNIIFRFFLGPIFFPEDIASRLEKPLTDKILEIYKEFGTTKIVCTGAPFMINYFVSKLKNTHGHFQVIHDFRDVWSLSRNSFSIKRFCLENCDEVVVVSEGLVKYFSEYGSKINVIHNGYSRNLFQSKIRKNQVKQNENEKIKILHLGNVTNGREFALLPLLDMVKKSKEFQDQVEIWIYGDMTSLLYLKIKFYFYQYLEKNIFIRKRISQEKAIEEVVRADYALLLNSSFENFDYSLPTKMYEYVALGMPIISINFGGEVESFINSHKLGISFNLKKVILRPNIFIEKILSFEKNESSNLEDFDFSNIAKRYSLLLG